MRLHRLAMLAACLLIAIPTAEAVAKTVARYDDDLTQFTLKITKSSGKTKASVLYVQTVSCKKPNSQEPDLADGTFKGTLSVGKHGKLRGTLAGTTDTGATLKATVHGKAGKRSAALKGSIKGSKPAVNGQQAFTCTGVFDAQANRVK